MPPPSEDRHGLALDAALAILLECGMGEVMPARVAERSGVPKYWFTRAGLYGPRELQLALLHRELGLIVAALEAMPGAENTARTLARHLPVLALAEHHSLLWDRGNLPNALRVAITPAPWWIAAAWTAICVEGFRRGVTAPELFLIMVDLERRHRE